TSSKTIPSLFQLTLFRLVTFALNYGIPSAQVGGEPARVYLLKKKGIPAEVAVSSVIIDKVFELSINVLFVVITLIILFLHHTPFKITGTVLIGLVVLILVWFYFQMARGKNFFTPIFKILHLDRIAVLSKLEKNIIDTENVIKTFFQHHTFALLKTIILSVMCFLLIVLEYFVILYFLGITPTLSQLLIITVLPLMGYLIPIPGAVGTLEAAHVAAFSLAGLDPVLALPTIIILRIRDILFVLAGLAYAYTVGFGMVKKIKDNTNSLASDSTK
ncbi:MAG: lysylphosphatidylglycerol synthase transmembrane domain-containing protein, partial [Patescibacteria group bacterium]